MIILSERERERMRENERTKKKLALRTALLLIACQLIDYE